MLVGIEPYYDIMVVDPLITGTALPSGAFFGGWKQMFWKWRNTQLETIGSLSVEILKEKHMGTPPFYMVCLPSTMGGPTFHGIFLL